MFILMAVFSQKEAFWSQKKRQKKKKKTLLLINLGAHGCVFLVILDGAVSAVLYFYKPGDLVVIYFIILFNSFNVALENINNKNKHLKSYFHE